MKKMQKINLYLDKTQKKAQNSINGFLGAFIYGALCVIALNLKSAMF